MAQIFVSYARTDRALVAPLVAALSAQGFSVWWDPAMNTGEEFDRRINSELEAAQAVIVAWTPTSVESSWVRGEAREAASRGILFPVRFGNARLPLDVRSLHTTDLDGWRGNADSAAFQQLLRALHSQLQTAEREPTGTVHPDKLRRGPRPGRRILYLGGAAALLVAAAVLLSMFATGRSHFFRASTSAVEAAGAVRIGVVPFEVLSESRVAVDFGGGVTDEIVSTLSANQMQTLSREDDVALHGANRDSTLDRLGVALLFEGTVEENGDDFRVRVHLDSTRSHAVVWSGEFTGKARDSRTLQTEVAAKCAGMIQMALFARASPAAIDDRTLATTLKVVDELRYASSGEGQLAIEAAQLAQRVVTTAPDFAWGHSIRANALYWESLVMRLTGKELQEQQRLERAEAQRALALDPRDAMAYFALSALATSQKDYESIVLKGLAADPHPEIFLGGLLGREAGTLGRTGRLREALPFARRAAALDSLSAWESVQLGSLLAALGQLPEAKDVFARCLSLWPNDPGVRDAYLGTLLFYDDPTKAIKVLDDPAQRPVDLSEGAVAALRAYLNAISVPKHDSRTPAVKAIQAAAVSGALPRNFAVPVLAELGDTESAYVTATMAAGQAGAPLDPPLLFIPATAGLRADPRFMRLAAGAGAAEYWLSTGKWPDFCSSEHLPYDCRTEAARAVAH